MTFRNPFRSSKLPCLLVAVGLFHLATGSALGEDRAGETSVRASLDALAVVASAPAEKRAVLRVEGELVLIRPGEPLPGLDGSEVESIGPRWIVARLDATRRAWISTAGDGEIRLLDLRPPPRPPISEPLWIVPRRSESSREEDAR